MNFQAFKSSEAGRWIKQTFFLIPPGLRVLNFLVQRIFRVNSECQYSVHYTSQVRQPQHLRLATMPAKCLAVMSNCSFHAHHGISIGENTVFASGLSLVSANHNFDDIVAGEAPKTPPITIGSNCWLGCNVIILPGVSIGNNTIVGAGSVVTKSFPADVVIAGNPANIVRQLGQEAPDPAMN